MIGSVDCRPNKLWKGMCMLPCTLAKRTSDSVSQGPVLWGHFTQKKSLQPGQFHQFHSRNIPPRSHICNLHICRRPQTRFPFRKGPKGSPVVGLWLVGLLRPLANSVFHLGSCFHPTKSTPQNTPTETSFFDTSFQMERNSFIHYYLVGELNHFQPI